jgi:Asp-tRNA(Asn)/Glu-tRNA(Gln) amidotransferase A subunit family amidase
VDLYAAPSFGVNLLLSNLTGHPAVVVPSAYSAAGKPAGSITFTGRLYDEARLLAVAKIYQDATDFHLRRPVLVDSE